MPTKPGFVWNGTEWVSLWSDAAVHPFKYQASAPTSPSVGDIWIDSDYDVPSVDISQFLRWRKTAIGGETTLSGADDTALVLQYTPNYEQVYLNGVLLVRDQDYTATTGTTITGLTALAANDVVEVFGVVARVVGDVYTQAQTNSLLDAKSNVSSTGLVLITSATMTSATTLQINNCFTSSYENYFITYRFNTSVADGANLRFSNGGTPTSGGTDYSYSRVYWTTTTNALNNGGVNGTSFIAFGSISSTIPSAGSWNVYSPALAIPTVMSGISSYATLGEIAYGRHAASTAYDGFNLTTNTSVSGTIKVYGYK